jgi:hypothetical protein
VTYEIWPDGLCTPYRLMTLAITSHAKHTGPRDNSMPYLLWEHGGPAEVIVVWRTASIRGKRMWQQKEIRPCAP